ncbi:hypothetical protein [uncultured Clostridium sp.]|uniref:hypothetical protein n=1 Tax=uncultured Clostridium sp. TaxID=59620 RepID=UPI002624CEA7|nr:hypothetical protein [uncultured Clostridium sp.]
MTHEQIIQYLKDKREEYKADNEKLREVLKEAKWVAEQQKNKADLEAEIKRLGVLPEEI